MARPTKYNPERAKRFLEAIRGGNTRGASCAYGGFSTDSLAAWIRRYPDFAEELARAESEAELAMVGVIRKAAAPREVKVVKVKQIPTEKGILTITETRTTVEFDWQAAAFWLKCRKRQDWSERVEIDNPEANKVGEQVVSIVQKIKSRVDKMETKASLGDTEP